MILMKPNFWQTKNFISLLLFPLTIITFCINFLKKFNIKNNFKMFFAIKFFKEVNTESN